MGNPSESSDSDGDGVTWFAVTENVRVSQTGGPKGVCFKLTRIGDVTETLDDRGARVLVPSAEAFYDLKMHEAHCEESREKARSIMQMMQTSASHYLERFNHLEQEVKLLEAGSEKYNQTTEQLAQLKKRLSEREQCERMLKEQADEDAVEEKRLRHKLRDRMRDAKLHIVKGGKEKKVEAAPPAPLGKPPLVEKAESKSSESGAESPSQKKRRRKPSPLHRPSRTPRPSHDSRQSHTSTSSARSRRASRHSNASTSSKSTLKSPSDVFQLHNEPSLGWSESASTHTLKSSGVAFPSSSELSDRKQFSFPNRRPSTDSCSQSLISSDSVVKTFSDVFGRVSQRESIFTSDSKRPSTVIQSQCSSVRSIIEMRAQGMQGSPGRGFPKKVRSNKNDEIDSPLSMSAHSANTPETEVKEEHENNTADNDDICSESSDEAGVFGGLFLNMKALWPQKVSHFRVLEKHERDLTAFDPFKRRLLGQTPCFHRSRFGNPKKPFYHFLLPNQPQPQQHRKKESALYQPVSNTIMGLPETAKRVGYNAVTSEGCKVDSNIAGAVLFERGVEREEGVLCGAGGGGGGSPRKRIIARTQSAPTKRQAVKCPSPAITVRLPNNVEIRPPSCRQKARTRQTQTARKGNAFPSTAITTTLPGALTGESVDAVNVEPPWKTVGSEVGKPLVYVRVPL